MKLSSSFSLTIVLLIAPSAFSADKDALQGDWVFESFVSMGRAIPLYKGKPFKVVGDKMQMKLGEREKINTYETDDTKSPKHIDIVFTNPDGKEMTSPGIYKIDGDKLFICSGGGKVEVNKETGKRVPIQGPRPTEFDSKKSILMVLKRKK